MSRLKAIELQLEPLRDQLKSHPLYNTLSNIEDVAVFMENLCSWFFLVTDSPADRCFLCF